MRHLLCGLAILLLAVTGAKADETIDRPFILVSGALIASTIFDAETTYAGYKDPNVHEANPIARPFVEAGRPALYAFEFASDAAILYVAYRMKKSDSPALRKGWWIIPVVVTVGHVAAGGANLRFVF